VLDVTDADVAVTGRLSKPTPDDLDLSSHQSRPPHRLAGDGREKAEMLARLNDGDQSILAGRVRQQAAVVLADQEATAALGRVASRR
jgi:hypothetical protein